MLVYVSVCVRALCPFRQPASRTPGEFVHLEQAAGLQETNFRHDKRRLVVGVVVVADVIVAPMLAGR